VTRIHARFGGDLKGKSCACADSRRFFVKQPDILCMVFSVLAIDQHVSRSLCKQVIETCKNFASVIVDMHWRLCSKFQVACHENIHAYTKAMHVVVDNRIAIINRLLCILAFSLADKQPEIHCGSSSHSTLFSSFVAKKKKANSESYYTTIVQ
jgi:hypothetical protein